MHSKAGPTASSASINTGPIQAPCTALARHCGSGDAARPPAVRGVAWRGVAWLGVGSLRPRVPLLRRRAVAQGPQPGRSTALIAWRPPPRLAPSACRRTTTSTGAASSRGCPSSTSRPPMARRTGGGAGAQSAKRPTQAAAHKVLLPLAEYDSNAERRNAYWFTSHFHRVKKIGKPTGGPTTTRPDYRTIRQKANGADKQQHSNASTTSRDLSPPPTCNYACTPSTANASIPPPPPLYCTTPTTIITLHRE